MFYINGAIISIKFMLFPCIECKHTAYWSCKYCIAAVCGLLCDNVTRHFKSNIIQQSKCIRFTSLTSYISCKWLYCWCAKTQVKNREETDNKLKKLPHSWWKDHAAFRLCGSRIYCLSSRDVTDCKPIPKLSLLNHEHEMLHFAWIHSICCVYDHCFK